jgi:metal-sulfur cluster biosynthetic enzyme
MPFPDPTPVPTSMPSEAALRDALGEVLDPEVGEPIVDLGLVERIEVAPARVDVTLVATSATCPMADVLVDDVVEAIGRACPPGTAVEAAIDYGIAWTPERMTPSLRVRFGWAGA